MTVLAALLAIVWLALAVGAHAFPAFAGTLIGAGVGATVSVAVFAATRAQAKRQTLPDLFKEYYSGDLAELRRMAERFMAKHAAADWSRNDPYLLGASDPDLAGYGAVLRFWQRVAAPYREDEVTRSLTQQLLSRELGFWNARIFAPMRTRKGMYVRGPIVDLAYKFSIGEGCDAFEAGGADGLRMVPPELEGPGHTAPSAITPQGAAS